MLKYLDNYPPIAHVRPTGLGMDFNVTGPLDQHLFKKMEMDSYTEAMYSIVNDNVEHLYRTFFESDQISYTETADYKKYGLIPGQQLLYYFGTDAEGWLTWLYPMSHHGIYMGNGIIFEVGPSSSKKKRDSVGLSNIEDFIARAKSKQGSISTDIYYVDFPSFENDNKDTMKRRLNGILSHLRTDGCSWDYDVLRNNCEVLANKISTGSAKTRQGLNAIQSAITTAVTGIFTIANYRFTKGPIVKLPECGEQYVTENCVCSSQPFRFWTSFYKYCYVDIGCAIDNSYPHDGTGYYGLVEQKKQKWKIVTDKNGERRWAPC
jgi:hypothetical protein